jgi:hypothetical protein
MHGFTGFLNFVHHPVFRKTWCLRMMSFYSQMERLVAYHVDPLEIADLICWLSVSNGHNWMSTYLLFHPRVEIDPLSKMLCSVWIQESREHPETQLYCIVFYCIQVDPVHRPWIQNVSNIETNFLTNGTSQNRAVHNPVITRLTIQTRNSFTLQ